MEAGRFTVVFQKMAEHTREMSEVEPRPQQAPAEMNADRAEAQEIAELRRVVLESSDPEPRYYSGT